MDVLRITRRFRGAIAVIAVLALILLVGPPAPASNSRAADGTRVRFSPSVPSAEPAPPIGQAVTYRFHELRTGVWGVGASVDRLPLLQVVRARTDSGVSASVVLDAAVRGRAARLQALVGAPAEVTRRTVFGGYQGAVVTAGDGRVVRTQYLTVRDGSLYVATVLYAPADADMVGDLLDALRFDD